MFDWFITALVLMVGTLLMVTGMIKYLFIGFMAYLSFILFMYCLSHVYLWVLKIKS
jgi:hypothetical protein